MGDQFTPTRQDIIAKLTFKLNAKGFTWLKTPRDGGRNMFSTDRPDVIVSIGNGLYVGIKIYTHKIETLLDTKYKSMFNLCRSVDEALDIIDKYSQLVKEESHA